jgi:excisionase family DNA binding protein
LLTPAQAAQLLQVRESWLRQRAAQRRVPCTFLGKHLRFSPADIQQIITDARMPRLRSPTGSATRSTPPIVAAVNSSLFQRATTARALTRPTLWPA